MHWIEIAVVEIVVESEEVSQLSHQVVLLVDAPMAINVRTSPTLQRWIGNLPNPCIVFSFLHFPLITSASHQFISSFLLKLLNCSEEELDCLKLIVSSLEFRRNRPRKAEMVAYTVRREIVQENEEKVTLLHDHPYQIKCIAEFEHKIEVFPLLPRIPQLFVVVGT